MRRVLWSIPVLVAVSLITFVLMHLAPGGPWDATAERPIPVENQRQIAAKYGWDQPLHVQYLSYMLGAIHGDLGPSYSETRPVNRIIAEELPVSAAFGGTALLIGTLAGIPF